MLRSLLLAELASAFGYFLLGWMGRFYEPLGPALYWALVACLPLTGLILLFTLGQGLYLSRHLPPPQEDGE